MMNNIRRSLLYIPGNQPAIINNAGIYNADVIVFDLEDSISIDEKDSARSLVKNAIINRKHLYNTNVEIMVRVNHLSTPFGAEDLEEIISVAPDSIRIPKVETAEELIKVHEIIEKLEKKYGIETKISTVAIIETLLGLHNIEEIVKSGFDRLSGLTLGAEDFTRDLGTERSVGGEELLYAREKLVFIAKLYNIDAIDTVFSNVIDLDALRVETQFIKKLGFTGKSAIHPSQVSEINSVFTPTAAEIENSVEILQAAAEAKEKGLGVIARHGRMIDLPVIKKSERIVNMAKNLGYFEEEGK